MEQGEVVIKSITVRGAEIPLLDEVLPSYIDRGLRVNRASMLPLTRVTLEEPHALNISVMAPSTLMDELSQEIATLREKASPTTVTVTVGSEEEYALVAPAFAAIFGEKLKHPRLGMPRSTTVETNRNLSRRFQELMESVQGAATEKAAEPESLVPSPQDGEDQ